MSLQGARILIGRPGDRSAELVHRLRRLGAEPLHLPCIRTTPLQLHEEVRREVEAAQHTQPTWWVLTSPAAVAPLTEALSALGRPPGLPAWIPIAAVGPGTEAVCSSHGLSVAFTPSQTTAYSLGTELPAPPGAVAVLWLGNLARTELEQLLQERGIAIRRITAYETKPDAEGASEAGRRLAAGDVDLVLLTSPSILDSIVAHYPGDRSAALEALRSTLLVSSGPTTTQHAESMGLSIAAEAPRTRIDDLVDALTAAGAQRASQPNRHHRRSDHS